MLPVTPKYCREFLESSKNLIASGDFNYIAGSFGNLKIS
jgi:hypothetical protein